MTSKHTPNNTQWEIKSTDGRTESFFSHNEAAGYAAHWNKSGKKIWGNPHVVEQNHD